MGIQAIIDPIIATLFGGGAEAAAGVGLADAAAAGAAGLGVADAAAAGGIEAIAGAGGFGAAADAAGVQNADAERALLRVRQKLDGTEDGELRSVEGQVQQLLQDARDPDKLCRLYPGWAAWV